MVKFIMPSSASALDWQLQKIAGRPTPKKGRTAKEVPN